MTKFRKNSCGLKKITLCMITMPEKRMTKKLMTKKQFERVRDKYRDVDGEADDVISKANDDARMELTLQEGSPFKVTDVEIIENEEDMVEVLQK